MLIEGLLCIVSLSPVRGPGPRATRLGAIADTLGRRSRIAVLIARDHEDAALSLQTLAERNATGSIRAWELPIEDHTPRFNQFRAHVYGLRRALEERHSWFFWMNDHTFVIAENLACYLSGLSWTEPVYAGLRLWGPCCGLFNSAAAGYAVNRAAGFYYGQLVAVMALFKATYGEDLLASGATAQFVIFLTYSMLSYSAMVKDDIAAKKGK